MKKLIQIVLVVLMLLAVAGGATNIRNQIGTPICPGALCEGGGE